MTLCESPANDLFFDDCRDNMTFRQLARTMVRDYDSDGRRHGTQSELGKLKVEKFMEEGDITEEAKAFAKSLEFIDMMTGQYSPSFRSESHQ